MICVSLNSSLLIACGVLEISPKDVYWELWEYCEIGDAATAESQATDFLIIDAKGYGICWNTHD